jgi:hypothetical protein
MLNLQLTFELNLVVERNNLFCGLIAVEQIAVFEKLNDCRILLSGLRDPPKYSAPAAVCFCANIT